MTLPLSFRNVVRYCQDVGANVPLYEALGFRVVRAVDGFAILENETGLRVLLHGADEIAPAAGATALGFTMLDYAQARAHVETAGWRLLREPAPEDEGFFYIYGDLDGNPINLVGQRK